MLNLDMLRLILTALPVISRLALDRTLQKIAALRHSYSYRSVTHPKNVVVIGGSFAGVPLVRRLAETLPTGYRVVLIERNSHLHHVFSFPRFSVIPGHEGKAFIPYDKVVQGRPEGVFELVRGKVEKVEEGGLVLEGGERVEWEYLVLATGCWQPFPARLDARGKREGCEELRKFQGRVERAESVVLVGGGAVGVEMAGDIKSYFPEKRVVLVHSRERLLPRFGGKLGEHAAKVLGELGVELRFGERPVVEKGEGDGGEEGGRERLRFGDGSVEDFDLVIPCTGQRANTDLIKGLMPDVVSKTTGEIKVDEKLQVTGDKPYPNIFALGDVAETGGPKMGRAGYFQAEIICQNVISRIHGQEPRAIYQPNVAEGSIKLTLGKDQQCIYLQTTNGHEILLPAKGGSDELEVRRFWHEFGVDMEKDSEL